MHGVDLDMSGWTLSMKVENSREGHGKKMWYLSMVINF